MKDITLFIFGGVSNIEQEPKSPGVEFQIALVGPLTSLLLGGLSFLLLAILGEKTSPMAAILGYLTIANILLGLFNFVPAFPLDGGRVFRSIIWQVSGSVRTATRVATLVSQVIAYLLIVVGIWLFFGKNLLGGLWIGFIGWFLLSSAQAANTQAQLEAMLKGVKVSEVMSKEPVTVPANISLQKLIDDFLLPHGRRNAWVVQADRLAGLMTLSEIRKVKRELWGQTPVGHAMIPLEHLHVVTPQQSLHEILPLMVSQDINQLPVIEHDCLVGVLSREDILRFLEIRRSLGLERENT